MKPLYHQRKTIDGVKKLKKISRSTILILEEAERLGIKWEKLPYTDIFKLQYRDKVEYFHAQIPSPTTALAVYCCNNKKITNNILEKAGLAVSRGYLIRHKDSEEFRKQLFTALQKPVVLKPTDGQQGDNIYLNINKFDDFMVAIAKIYQFYGQKKVDLLVEEMFIGDEYRILASQEKILSVIKRLPANVIGDGQSNIKALIAKKNQQPIRQLVELYQNIEINEELITYLKKQELTLESILPKQKRVFLIPHRSTNIARGGDTIDVTDNIHPSVQKIVDQIMSSIPGLAWAGIDYMTKDIRAEQTPNNYKIIEINASPSLDWNKFPLEGKGRPVVKEFLKTIFPEIG